MLVLSLHSFACGHREDFLRHAFTTIVLVPFLITDKTCRKSPHNKVAMLLMGISAFLMSNKVLSRPSKTILFDIEASSTLMASESFSTGLCAGNVALYLTVSLDLKNGLICAHAYIFQNIAAEPGCVCLSVEVTNSIHGFHWEAEVDIEEHHKLDEAHIFVQGSHHVIAVWCPIGQWAQ